jgi:hypothetical protein
MTPGHTRPQLHDPELPGFESLLTDDLPGPVSALLAEAESQLDQITPIQVTWRPGRQLIVRYRLTASGGGLAGQNDVVAVIGEIPEGSVVVEGPQAIAGMWVVPDDPGLPGLRSALHVPTLGRLLADLGSDDVPRFARLRAYRPGRRAVVEVGAGGSSLFLKVVPPANVASLHAKHRFLSDHVPVPDSLGLAPDLGIVVMGSLVGVDLRSMLRKGESIANHLVIPALVDSLPDPDPAWKTQSQVQSLPLVVDLLRRLVPDEAARLLNLQDRIGQDTDEGLVPVHGDFHEAQIIVDSGRVSGLIDVDTFGWGRPGDDAATMLGHLHLLAPGTQDPGQVVALARELNRHWDSRVDPVDLRKRTAAVVLGLATGPFRVQQPNWPEETTKRIEIAEQWVDSAGRVDEKSLIPASGRSHQTRG